METRATSTVAVSDDEWLDELEERPKERALTRVVRGPLRGPAELGRRVNAFTNTTPGKIIAMMLALTMTLLAAGLSMSQSMSQRNQALETVLSAAEPSSASAHMLSISLLQADTITAGSFVQPGPLAREDIAAYAAAVDQAVRSATDIYQGAVDAGGATSPRIQELAEEILRDLPVYTGLNERAKVNQRMGNPVGVAYMSESSDILRTRMLPAAAEINELTRQDVADEMRRLSQPQWVPLTGLFAALLLLGVAQWWLARVFRRRLNRGFLAATLAIVVAIGWVGVSNYASWRSGSVEYAKAAQPWEELTAARIDALEARTDETFELLRRQTVAQTSRGFDDTFRSVDGALRTVEEYDETGVQDAVAVSARGHLDGWAAEHEELVNAMDSGSYDQAVAILDTRGDGVASAAHYRKLDGALSELIAASRENTRAYIADSLNATRLVSAAVAILSIIAVVCVWIGIRRRLGEYL